MADLDQETDVTQEIIETTVGGHVLRLAVSPQAFRPTLTTRLLADTIEIPAGCRTLDMGCGVGPLAIAAAKNGASEVVAVDIVEEACELAEYNARLNGVADRVRVRHGDLFGPVEGQRFDVIMDDVSGMADEVASVSPWFSHGVPGGGPDGTEPTIRMLRQAKDHLTERGSLYFPVLSLANAPRILEEATRIFGDGVTEILQKNIPFCPELQENLSTLEALKSDGIIDYQKKRQRYLWSLTVLQACAGGA